MKTITPETIRNILIPGLLEKRYSYNTCRIDHIIPEYAEYDMPAVLSYTKILGEICTTLDIEYKQHLIYADPNNMFSVLKTAIDVVNNSPETDGILYGFPFKSNKLGTVYTNLINPKKDLEFYTAAKMGGYLTYEDTSKLPPYQFAFNFMVNNVSYIYEFNKITVLTNQFNSHKGLIPLYNINYGNYTFVNILNLRPENCKSDILISLLENGPSDSEYMLNSNLKFDADMILDFGYNTRRGLYSLDASTISNESNAYKWEDGLMELYVFGIINNLFK